MESRAINTNVTDKTSSNNSTYSKTPNPEKSKKVISSPILASFGKDSATPIKLEIPLRSVMTLILIILPRAKELRFMGVTRRVAMVPRSFSPAMKSGAMAQQPEKSIVRNNMGMMAVIMRETMSVPSFKS